MANQKDKIIQSLREEYRKSILQIEAAADDPFVQFGLWFDAARQSQVPEPNAMTLASATREGRPSARIVLLKGFDERGFRFFTNYQSRKGRQLSENPFAALVFCWLDLERQIRIEGRVEKLSDEDSTAYFVSRPKGSQIGAWASPQSQVIQSRSVLDEQVRQLNEEYRDQEHLPRPSHWGGFVLVPDRIEFWQGRSSRLHDRILYTRSVQGWKKQRLAP